jgi:hypothetical protein
MVGRAMKELGVQMIPSYSSRARGRSERNFSTWQGRLPQELRLRGIRTLGLKLPILSPADYRKSASVQRSVVRSWMSIDAFRPTHSTNLATSRNVHWRFA